ncbi:MAG: Cache 3/Cache 2 fusion domain-containing protein [Deltaproteobacteria bacterium]|nr:Cache 3/Cache 2 fusion domain-containing protein [Deltaproteobacteria bacterium]
MPYHLKTRIAITVSLLILGFLILFSGLTLAYFEQKFKAATFSHFADSLSITADGLSNKIEQALHTLEVIKEAMPVDILGNPERMQAFLDEQNTDLLKFDNGIMLFGPEGYLLAINPKQEDVIGVDFSFRDYIKITLQTKQPYISAPFTSRQKHQHPIIMLTEPIINEDDEVVAILGGSFDLYGNNLLQKLITSKVGKEGYYLMIDQQETMVIHPNKENILRSADNFFPREQIVDFLMTSHGPVTKMTMDGQEMIGFFQHVSPLNWTLVALSPLEENYLPIRQARTYLIFALVILSALTILIVRVLSNRLTSPLIDLTEKVRLQTSREDVSVDLETGEYEELGDLAHSIQLLITDVSIKRKGLQLALQEAQTAKEQVDNILRSTADGLIVTDQHNRVTLINQIAAEMLGVSAEKIRGQKFTELFVDSKLREQAKAFWTETDHKSRKFDFKLNLSDNQFPRIVQARSSILWTESGKRSGLVTLLHDVSRERELDQIKSEFISTAAHEMRTPMSVIMGYIELLMDKSQFGHFTAEKQQEFLGAAYRKSKALAQIVNDLFDTSRIESGLPLPIDRTECDLNKVLSTVVSHYEIHTSKHSFKMNLDGQAMVSADGNKMTQVFENLISNAIKYSPDGGEIEVRSTLKNDYLRIDIEDQGSGMTAEQLERIFDKFYRADSVDSTVSGLGLGMSIVKAIVEGHDGRIWVESTPGKGTCVSLEIPCRSGSKPSNADQSENLET